MYDAGLMSVSLQRDRSWTSTFYAYHCKLARESAMYRLRVTNIRYGSYGVSFHCMFMYILILS